MPVVALTTLWLAASTPAAPATESSDEPLPVTTAAGNPPDGRNKLKASQPPTTTIKKTGSDNDEPGCEE
jgi:hypothetical protein